MQLTMLNLADPVAIRSAHKQVRKVEDTLSKMKVLHEELNKYLHNTPGERPMVSSPKDAYEILAPLMSNLMQEELWTMLMNTRNRVMKLVAVYKGSVNSTQIRLGEIFRQAVIENAPAIIVAHCHPSGDPTPSPEDVAMTRALVQAGNLLDIDVLDHLIIGHGRFVSLKDRGLGFDGK